MSDHRQIKMIPNGKHNVGIFFFKSVTAKKHKTNTTDLRTSSIKKKSVNKRTELQRRKTQRVWLQNSFYIHCTNFGDS